MHFHLATPQEVKKILFNVSKLKIYLTTGIIEVLDKHQDLLGKIGVDLLEVDVNEDTKSEKLKFVIQTGVVVVSNKGIPPETFPPQASNIITTTYIYGKRIVEITSNLSIEEFSKNIEQNSLKLESEKQALKLENEKEALKLENEKQTLKEGTLTTKKSKKSDKSEKIKTNIFSLENDIEFDKKVLYLIKESKN